MFWCLVATALAADPTLVLPSGQDAAAWMSAATLAGFRIGPSGTGREVEIVPAGGGWVLIARDGRGGEKRTSIPAPGTAQAREDAVWLGSSLLASLPPAPPAAPAPPPGRLAPTAAPAPSPGASAPAAAPRVAARTPAAPAPAVPSASGAPAVPQRPPARSGPGGAAASSEPPLVGATPAGLPPDAPAPAKEAPTDAPASNPGLSPDPRAPAGAPPPDPPPLPASASAPVWQPSGGASVEVRAPTASASDVSDAATGDGAPAPAERPSASPVAPEAPAGVAPPVVAPTRPALRGWVALGPAMELHPVLSFGGGGVLDAGLRVAPGLWVGAEARWLAPRTLPAIEGSVVEGTADVALGAWWCPDRRGAPWVGGTVGASARAYGQGSRDVADFFVAVVGAEAGAVARVTGPVSVALTLRGALDLAETEVVVGDNDPVALPRWAVGAHVSLRLSFP